MNRVYCHQRVVAEFVHVRQAIACLPALANVCGAVVYLEPAYNEPSVASVELPSCCSFEFFFRNMEDLKGCNGIRAVPNSEVRA